MMSSINTILRPVQDIDHDFLLSLFKTTPEAAIYAELPDKLRQHVLQTQFVIKEQAYAQMYPLGENCIVEFNHNPVGRFFVNIAPDEIRLVDIIIHPSSRNQGIGSSLLQLLLSRGDTKKTPIRLKVAVDNVAAQHLYQKHGFIAGYNDGVHIYCEYLSA